MIDLSVCITTYNLEKCIDQTLELVFSQKTNYSYEVLIGDDGSSDKTIEKIKKWKEKYPNVISYFVMDRDKDKKYDHIIRASSNRYNLLKHAKGKYITFLDGDDFYIDDNKFEKQIGILEKNLDCNLCAHNMNYYYENSGTEKPIASSKTYMKEQKISFKKFWISGFYIPAEACIFRNNFDINEKNDKFYTGFFDDNFIVFMALTKGKCFYIPDIMANYRQNENGYANWDEIKRELINLFDLDMEIQFNSKSKKLSQIRHFYGLNKLYKIQSKNLKDNYPELYSKAIDNNCSYTKKVMEGKMSKSEMLSLRLKYYLKKAIMKIKNLFC